MAIIPLKQTITVAKSAGLDGWGEPILGDELTFKARVTETTKVVTNSTGEEATATLRIVLDKLADISYDDAITYENELGVIVTREPLKIEVKRHISGRPILTEVFV